MRYPSIRFLGLWDTVSSLLRVKWGNGTFIQYGTHSSVDSNPYVESVRHVLAIDETRRFFRHQFWEEGHKYYQNRFNYKRRKTLKRKFADQDVKQVWFAGTHTDVAGSVYEPEAGLAKITMNWMKEELDGLGVDKLSFRTISYNR